MDENIKILSWNINGLRSQRSNFKQFLDDLQSHIICFQETKITRDQLEEDLAVVDGYVSFFSFSRKRSGYSGVATYCRKEATPSFAQEGLSGVLNIGSLSDEADKKDFLSTIWDAKDLKDLDAEGRCIITQHPFMNARGEKKLLSILNVYCPRADPERPERAVFKLSFYKLLKQRAAILRDTGSFVIILGDLNTSHRKIDHCDPCDDEEFEKRDDRMFLDAFLVDSSAKTSKSSTLINEELLNGNSEEHDKESEAYEAFKVVDTYRHFYPDKKEAFTCWNTKVNARSTNYGTRLDYVLCDEDFVEHVKDAAIHQDILGSDHCPVSIEVTRVRFLSAHVLPAISTKFYPEFQGSQQKLSSYFKLNSNANEVKPDSAAQQTSGCQVSADRAKRKMDDKCSRTKNKKNIGTTQSTINSYFIKNSSDDLASTESNSRNTLSGTDLCDKIIKDDSKFSDKCLEVIDNSNKSLGNESSGWSFMMKAPAPAPLCSGHKEPAVLRTVKKKGPTWNKQFYSCARGVGKETDPNSRCNFFQWFKHGR